MVATMPPPSNIPRWYLKLLLESREAFPENFAGWVFMFIHRKAQIVEVLPTAKGDYSTQSGMVVWSMLLLRAFRG